MTSLNGSARAPQLLATASGEKRKQSKVEWLVRCDQLIVNVVHGGTTAHLVDMPTHSVAITTTDYTWQHWHLLLRFRVLEQQDRIVEIKLQLVLIQNVKGDQVVAFEAKMLKRRLQ